MEKNTPLLTLQINWSKARRYAVQGIDWAFRLISALAAYKEFFG